MMVMGTYIIYPILPVIHESLDIPKAQIGLVLSAFTLPAIFMAPLAGFIADLQGRKWIMVIGLFIYGAAGLSIGLVNGFKWLLVLRAMQGVGYSGVMPLVVVIIGDTYTKQQETAAQGMKVFVDRIGALCLPAIAGLLGTVAWQAPFILYGMAIPIAACVLRWLPEPDISRHRRLFPYFKGVFTLARRLRCLVIFSMSSLRFFLEYGFFTYLPIFALYSVGVSVAKGGFLFSIYAVGAMITATQLGALVMRYERMNLVIVAFFIQGFCLLATPLVHRTWWLAIVMFIFGLANGVISPTQKSLLTQSAPGELRGGVVSIDRILQNVFKTASPPITGLILAFSNVELVFRTLGVIAVVWVISVLFLKIRGYLRGAQHYAADKVKGVTS
jgi:MFS family permease